MAVFHKFYRLSQTGTLLILGGLILVLITACSSGAQAEPKELQAASAQAFGDNEPIAASESQPSSQLTQPSDLVAQPQPAVEVEQTNPLAVEVALAAAESSPTMPPTEFAAPTATPGPDSGNVSGPSAPADSNPAAQANTQVEVKPEVGFQAPDFTLQMLDGQTVRLSDLKGRPVFITYWSTWCVPCKAELPILQRIHQELGQSEIQMLTINAIEQDKLEAVQGFVGELGLSMPVLLDHQNQFQSAYNQLFFPTSYFIDSNGVIRFIKLGDASETDLRTNIEKLINNQL